MENNTWIYYNGELYHAGVKGMQWGKHLPGTDWWKQTTEANYNSITSPASSNNGKNLTYKTAPEWLNRARANIRTAGQAAKIYGNKFKAATASARVSAKQFGRNAYNRASLGIHNTKKEFNKFFSDPKKYTSEQAAKLSEFAKTAYSEARKNVINFFTTDSNEINTNHKNRYTKSDTPLSHLDTFQNKQLDDACRAYTHSKASGSFGDKLNYWFQNAQYGIVKGVNNYLKQIGMDDEVDDFISRFKGDSSFRKNRNKRNPTGGHQNNITYMKN